MSDTILMLLNLVFLIIAIIIIIRISIGYEKNIANLKKQFYHKNLKNNAESFFIPKILSEHNKQLLNIILLKSQDTKKSNIYGRDKDGRFIKAPK